MKDEEPAAQERPRGRAALLLLDLTVGVATRMDGAPAALTACATAHRAARSAGIPVIFVRVAFRPGHPEVSHSNKIFAPVAAADRMIEGDPSSAIHEQVAPMPDDLIVTKRRISAFTGSDLEVILRSQQVDTLVLAGMATSGVVLSTVTEAADRDYRLTVLSDGCADADPELHTALVDRYFPQRGTVISAESWAATVI